MFKESPDGQTYFCQGCETEARFEAHIPVEHTCGVDKSIILKGERRRIIEQIRTKEREKILKNVGALGQWINEKPKERLITNNDIIFWLIQ